MTVRPGDERDHDIVRWTEPDRGGRCFAGERPELMAADLRARYREPR